MVVLSGKESINKELAPLQDDENVFLAGVDNRKLAADSYVQIVEMLRIALQMALSPEIPPPQYPNINVIRSGKFWIFIPKAAPMKYEELQLIYSIQKFA